MKRFGELKPRYLLFLNRYDWFRASKCMKCDKLTALRKFPFLIHFKPRTLLNFGLTARYCSKCEFIVLHKKDIEEYFFQVFGEAKEYFVIGTTDRKLWKQGLDGKQPSFKETIKNASDFKEILDYEMQPAGWYFDDGK